MKKLLKHYMIEEVKKENQNHIFVYEVVERPLKKQDIKDQLAKVVAKKLENKNESIK